MVLPFPAIQTMPGQKKLCLTQMPLPALSSTMVSVTLRSNPLVSPAWISRKTSVLSLAFARKMRYMLFPVVTTLSGLKFQSRVVVSVVAQVCKQCDQIWRNFTTLVKSYKTLDKNEKIIRWLSGHTESSQY